MHLPDSLFTSDNEPLRSFVKNLLDTVEKQSVQIERQRVQIEQLVEENEQLRAEIRHLKKTRASPRSGQMYRTRMMTRKAILLTPKALTRVLVKVTTAVRRKVSGYGRKMLEKPLHLLSLLTWKKFVPSLNLVKTGVLSAISIFFTPSWTYALSLLVIGVSTTLPLMVGSRLLYPSM